MKQYNKHRHVNKYIMIRYTPIHTHCSEIHCVHYLILWSIIKFSTNTDYKQKRHMTTMGNDWTVLLVREVWFGLVEYCWCVHLKFGDNIEHKNGEFNISYFLKIGLLSSIDVEGDFGC